MGNASWSRLAHLGEGDDYVLDHILINSEDGTIYVSAWSVESTGGDIFVSRDGGRSWKALEGMRGKSVRSFAMAASGGAVAQGVLIDKSEIRFVSKQMGASVEGRFRRWKANVDFRPNTHSAV